MLRLLDLFFTGLHLVIICFNLFGWLWPRYRKWHFLLVLATAASWLLLGLWFGLGYCPITDWQWQVKTKLGERNLPNSFIKYYADWLTGLDFNPALVDTWTAILFGVAALLSVYFNFIQPKIEKGST
ncbi:DUF2784 domain-containing protein [Adhaeribacter rhizoryzae]|uniref:DUF2784 domain-containing protein n=1 Tax=Adhaeribacter rhizoryzae TaxID=2607907 RepID=A0A5M6D7M5_9BACT|nr:DUF2784 domain-containing protein [Adhaeribacter rhizoryzae]KAA5543554.1 DUF2784 domain-containing protein [Adhaeribacter rhizoryzae]